MNLPAVSPRELLDQKLAAEERSALWSQVVVRAIVEVASQPAWFPQQSREEPTVSITS